ncbi:MAG: Hpt domain-containing protein [Pirellulaceae bacterium]
MPIIDTRQLLEQIEGDDDLLQETSTMLCEEAEQAISRLQQALASSDLAQLKSEAHSVKGMLSNFFADAACETAYKLECLQDSSDFSAVNVLLEQLQQQMATMQGELQQLIASRAS